MSAACFTNVSNLGHACNLPVVSHAQGYATYYGWLTWPEQFTLIQFIEMQT